MSSPSPSAGLMPSPSSSLTPSPGPTAGPSASSPGSTPAADEPVVSSTTATVPEGKFRLSIRVARGIYLADESIEVSARLAYLGPRKTVALSGSGVGLVVFGVKQLDGHLENGYASTDDCVGYTIHAGEPYRAPYDKSGGYGSLDPDRDFWKEWLSDPLLRLPTGRWQITAQASFVRRGCGSPERRILASVVVEVR